MRPGREIDVRIAQEIFGQRVFVKKGVLHEETADGDRPLRMYTKEMEWAWEVAVRMSIGVLPIEGGGWFAMVGGKGGWASPQAFINYLQNAEFQNAGAAIDPSAPKAICLAAINALENRKARESTDSGDLGDEQQQHHDDSQSAPKGITLN